MNKNNLAGLSVFGGILTGLAWTGWCSGLILLVALVPFFLIENYIFENPKRFSINSFFLYLLPGFVVFSIMSMAWMSVASITGAICVILGLSFMMALTMWLAHIIRVKAGNIPGAIALLTFWLGQEYITLNVNIISPWLNLGNGLSKDILFIQWYDITGTAGGSLWILCSNLFLTIVLVNSVIRRTGISIYIWLWLIVVIMPAAFSFYRYNTISQNKTFASEVVIIQPNIDPYTEKFRVPFEIQLRKIIGLAIPHISETTDWIITPETTVDDPVNIDSLENDKYINLIKDFIKPYPQINVVSGFVTFKIYPPMQEAPTASARKTDLTGKYCDHFNSAVKIDTSNAFSIYHKSKLVPGIEMQFSYGPGKFITQILPYLGGTNWGYGIQKERISFEHTVTSIKTGPVICYESVFGKFVTEYVKKGAEVLFIITNDGWWKNTNGYKQHLNFASLRAIETRRWVARSANTGISCIIDTRGKRIEETKWWARSVLKGIVYPETKITTYVRYGDYLLFISAIISMIILLAVFVVNPTIKKFKHYFQ